MTFSTVTPHRVSVIYGVRLGKFGYGHEPDELTEMLANEYGLGLLRFPQIDRFLGWYDVVVTNVGSFGQPYVNHTISSKGMGGRIVLDPDPDPDLTERLNKFRSDHEGHTVGPQWYLYVSDTSLDDPSSAPTF